MNSLLRTPLDQWLAERWQGFDRAHRLAFFTAACVSLLAFGFEMANLTLHHDDLNHLMVGKPLVGWYLGRFVHSWLFYYGQQGFFLPFVDMTIGIVLMCLYGVLVAHFWGARRTLDLALVAAVVCVFPYMAHVYQYNSVMVAYPLAHLLAAGGVALAARARGVAVAVAALLIFVAFSIYQAVLANAVTVLLGWLLFRVVFAAEPAERGARVLWLPVAAALAAVAAGGALHVLAVWSMNVPFDAAQGADQAFSVRSRLEHGLRLAQAAAAVFNGTRAFFVWPEAYLPQPLKGLHALFLAGAAAACLLVPRGWAARLGALALLALLLLAPRTLQLLHPLGTFHNLTLTAYALVVAAGALLIVRAAGTALRNAALMAGGVLVAGYVAQCAWISTVNVLNTQAHMAAVTQILARLRALPDAGWDGRTIAVVGQYDMANDFPFRPATGVANEFLRARHMDRIARLLRDEAKFVGPEDWPAGVAPFAAGRPVWPHPQSVGVVDGVGVVVLSHRGPAKEDAP